MKKLVLISAVFVLLLLATTVIAESENKGFGSFSHVRDKVLDQEVEYQYLVHYFQSERHRIGMNAAIAWMESEEIDTGNLESTRDSFMGLQADLTAAYEVNDPEEIKNTARAMKQVAKQFRDEARDLIDQTQIDDARDAVKDAYLAEADYLTGLEDQVHQAHINLVLALTDAGITGAEERIQFFEDQGMDITALNEKLDEIRAQRDELAAQMETARESCAGDIILRCGNEDAEDYRALRSELKDMFKELKDLTHDQRRGVGVSKTLERFGNVLAKFQERIDQLPEDVDATEIQSKLDETQLLLDEAQAQYDEGDFKGTQDTLKEVKDKLKDAQKELRDFRKDRREKIRDDRKENREKDRRLADDIKDDDNETEDDNGNKTEDDKKVLKGEDDKDNNTEEGNGGNDKEDDEENETEETNDNNSSRDGGGLL